MVGVVSLEPVMQKISLTIIKLDIYLISLLNYHFTSQDPLPQFGCASMQRPDFFHYE